MAELPVSWTELVENLNGRVVFGQKGVRDLSNPCEAFDPVQGIDWLGVRITAVGNGDCDTDGHYLCNGCSHLSRRAVLERLDRPFCPNCNEEAPGGLYAYEVQQADREHDSFTVTHCGCFYEGTPDGKRHHHLIELPSQGSSPGSDARP